MYRIAFEKILTLILGEGDCLRLIKTGLTVPYFLKKIAQHPLGHNIKQAPLGD